MSADQPLNIVVPDSWPTDSRDWRISSSDDLTDALFDPCHPAREIAGAATDFADQLFAALLGPARCAVVSYPPQLPVRNVALLVGEVLGGARLDSPMPIAGPMAEVESSNGKENWHVDSTPWLVPNRWSILGTVHCEPAYVDALTHTRPFVDVLATWPDRNRYLDVLSTHLVDWRATHSGIGEVLAPVLPLGGPIRWMPFLVGKQLADQGIVGSAFRSLRAHIDSTTTGHATAVGHAKLLVFDNHRVIHRGPEIDRPTGRVLLRLKVGGFPDRRLGSVSRIHSSAQIMEIDRHITDHFDPALVRPLR
jgi:hypothetical protein